MESHAEFLSKDSVRFERDLPGPIDRVWQYLVDPAKRALWLCGGATDTAIDGTIVLAFDNSTLSGPDDDPAPTDRDDCGKPVTFSGTVTRYEPPHVFAHTWDFEGQSSEVCYELSETDSGVHLVLTHTRLASDEEVIGVCSGWHAHLGLLADVLEERKLRPFYRTMFALEAEYTQRVGS